MRKTGFGFWSGNFVIARWAVTSVPYTFVNPRSGSRTASNSNVRASDSNVDRSVGALDPLEPGSRDRLVHRQFERLEERLARRVRVDQHPVVGDAHHRVRIGTREVLGPGVGA